ncbi:hypothetical protein AXF42_Ash008630 [Apostasia shenzhenica]|uniref:Uncharacterized protein n=1 Tax=Apostasia shenzhenica TaxID=1088818 RepID=A0A2I0B1X7_9ASPA|nr:hypothetical protein AXF42_Ash008630 [Apostasia shenzhenica]
MAYRRKGGAARPSTFDDIRSAAEEPTMDTSPPSSLAARAIRASSAHWDSSLSSVYGQSAIASAHRESNRQRMDPPAQESSAYEYTSMSSLNENKHGFWGVLARKAKSLIEDDNAAQKLETLGRDRPKMVDKKVGKFVNQSHQQPKYQSEMENPPFQRSSDSIASSLNYIGGTIKNALEEGFTIVENRTADIIQETRKLQIRKKGTGQTEQNQATDKLTKNSFPQIQTDYETQLKASRDVANAMAAKAKLLMRELKTVKADLAFAKERCAQLEEENKVLRDSVDEGSNPEDDDLIRLQLETLLAEKGRLAHENSVYARENRFLREIVEYHQLTMQDVIYMDEGTEEVTEVCPIPPRSSLSSSPASNPRSSSTPPVASIVVPETCPIVPMPPSPVPDCASKGLASGSTRVGSVPSHGEDEN